MKRALVWFAIAVLLSSCRQTPPAPVKQEAAAAPEKKHRRHRSSRGHKARAKSAEPGAFDFYVMALSWSPGFCATPAGKNAPLQCGPGRRFAFVLHGLWPQHEERGWPENCSTENVDEALVQSMLTIMPSPKLVRHEWDKHGTCSGLSPAEYFEEAGEAFRKIKIPPKYEGPKQQIMVDPKQMQRDLAAANPSFSEQSFSVACSGNGRFLQEVRVCLTKELEGRPCNREVLRGGCRSEEVIMTPLR